MRHGLDTCRLALDLLNRSLALNSISPRDLLSRADGTTAFSGTEELDSLREALRGQVPNNAVRGLTEAFSISLEKLDEATKRTARILAQLASTPIPEAFVQALPDEYKSPRVRVALVSRHFVTAGDGLCSRGDASAHGRFLAQQVGRARA